MGFNHFWMLVTFQYRGLYHLDMYCTLIIEAWLKSNIHFYCRYLEIWSACIISLVFIVLNVRDGTKSKYPSIIFSEYISLISYCKGCECSIKDQVGPASSLRGRIVLCPRMHCVAPWARQFIIIAYNIGYRPRMTITYCFVSQQWLKQNHVLMNRVKCSPNVFCWQRLEMI